MEMSKSSNKNNPHAILFAFPLQGHVNPSVHLAMKLASKGLSITFITTHNIHHKITLSNPVGGNDIFVEARSMLGLDIDYVTVSDGLPMEYDRSLNQDQWSGAINHCLPAHVEVAVAKIVKARSCVSCLIVDTYLGWGYNLAKKFGLLYVSFWTEPAMVLDFCFHIHLLKENGHIGPGSSAKNDTEINYIPGITSMKRMDLAEFLQVEDLTTMKHRLIVTIMDNAKQADFILANTVQELEAHTIAVIHAQTPFYAIGPIFPPVFAKSPVATSLWAELDCTRWLDSKPCGSVMYISFGSFAHVSKEELQEIAHGIKLSGVNFLWSIRPDIVSSNDPNPLPDGFREEVCDRGMIVTWTCQTSVLSHRAIGGFLTHCGWNSTLESIWCEVPLLCFPLTGDQFPNRKLIVHDWKIGRNMCEKKSVKRDEVMQNVKDIIGGSKSHELNVKIKEIKQVLEDAMTTKGSSERNLDSFIENLIIAANDRETVLLE